MICRSLLDSWKNLCRELNEEPTSWIVHFGAMPLPSSATADALWFEIRCLANSRSVLKCEGPTPLIRYQLVCVRVRLQSNGRGFSIREPMAFGPEIFDQGSALVCAPLSFGNLAGGKRLEEVVPPIEPAPKKRGKPSGLHDRLQDIKALGRFDSFAQPAEDCPRFFRVRAIKDVPGVHRPLQAAQLVDHNAARHEDGDFRCAQEKCRIFLRLNANRLNFGLQDVLFDLPPY